MKSVKITITVLTVIAFIFIVMFSLHFSILDLILSIFMSAAMFGICLLFLWEPELTS